MNILLLLCDNLMQKTAYEKYYRFFSGFLLVLCLLKPVIDFAGTEPYFYASFLQKEWQSERNRMKYSKELSEVEAVVQKECEAAYKKQIEEVAEQYGISVKKVTNEEVEENSKEYSIEEAVEKGTEQLEKQIEEEIEEKKSILRKKSRCDRKWRRCRS